ncbi:hypothetical protein ACTJJ7_18865 [Phyllobacterium sp. 22229]
MPVTLFIAALTMRWRQSLGEKMQSIKIFFGWRQAEANAAM